MRSYAVCWIVWFTVLALAVAASSRLLMDVYFGSIAIPEISHPAGYRYLFAFTFYPVLLALKITQFGPLLLLGMAGFLYFEMSNQRMTAGMLLSLMPIKPHLSIVLFLAMALRREWKVIVGAGVSASAVLLVTLYQDPRVLQQYWALMTGPLVPGVSSGILAGVRESVWRSPRLLAALGNNFWIQLVPTAGVLMWFAYYWRRHRASWCWRDRMPVIITASILGAPYGFVSDQSLLILPVIYFAASAARAEGRLPLRLVAIYTALNATVLIVAIYSTSWAVLPLPVAIAGLLALPDPAVITGTAAAPTAGLPQKGF